MPKEGEGLSVTDDGTVFRDLLKKEADTLLGEREMSILVAV